MGKTFQFRIIMKWFNTSKPYLLSASLICGNPLDLAKEIEELEKAEIDSLHFDVMDGHFVPRIGLYSEMLKAITSATDIPVDVHLMIDSPGKHIPAFAAAGADLITIHAEAVENVKPVIQIIKDLGMLAGIALKPDTPLNTLDPILDDIDLVLLMAIHPGILGQKLIPGTFQKISDLKDKLKSRPEIVIEIDGGVTPESAPKMVEYGANLLVCGTGTIYRPHEDTLENKIISLRKTINAAIHES